MLIPSPIFYNKQDSCSLSSRDSAMYVDHATSENQLILEKAIKIVLYLIHIYLLEYLLYSNPKYIDPFHGLECYNPCFHTCSPYHVCCLFFAMCHDPFYPPILNL